jgi:biotin operon repressor
MTAKGTPSGSFHFSHTSNATSASVMIAPANIRSRQQPATIKAAENAVYAHIQALRSLGRETINTADIAVALGLSVEAVNRAAAALKSRGVKVA